jgi:predicted lipoprotein
MRLRVVSIALLLLLHCQTKPTPTPSDSFDRAALLRSVSEGVIEPALAEAAAQAQTLAAAVSRDEARAAWRTTMEAWQRVELMQVGPAAVVGTSAGAQGLRDTIYAWPVVNDCLVDQETLRKGYEASDFFSKALPAATGLGAIEYLLFRPDTDNACASFVGIGAQWDALSEDDINTRRLAYARTLAARVATQTQTMKDAWAAHAPTFLASGQTGVDEIFAALFYLDFKV